MRLNQVLYQFVIAYLNGLAVQARVIGAVIIRDTRTRFGRTFAGYAIMIMWPLAHVSVITTVYFFAHRVAPVGSSVPIFAGTGVLPYILCFYPARWTMFSVVQNHPLLHFPVVKSVDLPIARGILEITNALWVTTLFCLSLYLLGYDVIPADPSEAVFAILATLFLGFSIGFLAAIMYKLFRPWLAIQIGLLIVMYVTAGVFFLPSALPEKYQEVLWFNPLLHSVEWLRSAYFPGYGSDLLSKSYLISYAAVVLFLGLITERLARRRLLET
jgi:capsular polysaccharide transport system permease protein